MHDTQHSVTDSRNDAAGNEQTDSTPAAPRQRVIREIPVSSVIVSPDRRPVTDEARCMMVSSISEHGLRTPITVRRVIVPDPTGGPAREEFHLVTGATRLAAADDLFWDTIPAFVEEDCDELQARLLEIIENLHRNDLTKLERDEQTAEYIQLVDERNRISAQVEPKIGRGRPQGGINRASRDLRISRTNAQRAMKTKAITPEAKAVAHETGLDNNQTALLEIANALPQDQVRTAHLIAERKRRTGSVKKQVPQKQAHTSNLTQPSTSTPVQVHNLATPDSGGVNQFHSALEYLADPNVSGEKLYEAVEHLRKSEVTARQYWDYFGHLSKDPRPTLDLARSASAKLVDVAETARLTANKIYEVVIKDGGRM